MAYNTIMDTNEKGRATPMAKKAKKDDPIVFVPCHKCGGTGNLPHYGHISNGICFACGGSRGEHVKQSVLDRRQKAREYRARKKAEKLEAAKRAQENKRTENLGDLLEVLRGLLDHHNPRVQDIASDLWHKAGKWNLSDAQRGLIVKLSTQDADRARAKAERDAKAATLPPLTEGRQEFTGTVKSIKESEFRPNSFVTIRSLKMLVELPDGNRLFGTVPSSIEDDVEIGDTVTLTGTVKVKEPGFGFFSRPAKPTLIKAAA